ncbi:hypothetical protein [Enterobacter bugandensis]
MNFNFFHRKRTIVFSRNVNPSGITETGYIENYKPNEDALVLHGSQSMINRVNYSRSVLCGYQTEKVNATELVEKIKKDYGLDLRLRKKPLHLISCYVSSCAGNEFLEGDVFAQNLANITGRVILTYDDGDTVGVNQGPKSKLKYSKPRYDNGKKMKPKNIFTPSSGTTLQKNMLPRVEFKR